jgi:hypothetical protein
VLKVEKWGIKRRERVAKDVYEDILTSGRDEARMVVPRW